LITTILKHKNQFWLLVAIVVAFALRVYMLGAQSLWNDEGTSVALSQLSLDAITNGAAHDIHPPLYYYLLHFWMPFVGNTEYAVRFLSVIAGVVTVAIVFRIAYVFFDEEISIIAAYLAAFSPFQVYYSQEARMYIWVTMWAAVSVLAMTEMFKRTEDRGQRTEGEPLPTNSRAKRSLYWLLYIVSTIAMLYTQYVGAFVVIAENIAFAVWLLFAIKPRLAGASSAIHPSSSVKHSVVFWVAAQIIAGSVFLPWYLFAGGQLSSWPSISEPLDLQTLLWRVLNVFSVGLTMDANAAALSVIAFGILFFIGWKFTRDVNANWVVVTLILWTLVPVAVMYIVSLSRPAYNPKFLLLATPAFYILAARGLSTIYPGVFLHEKHGTRRPSLQWLASLAIAIPVVTSLIPSLQNYYSNPIYARDDYRSILQTIDSSAHDGDGILVDAPGQIDVVRYYHRGSQQMFLLPRMRPPEPTLTRNDVDDMLGKTRRLFAIYWAADQSDPQRIIETRLAEKAFKASDEWHGNIRLAVYGVAPTVRKSAEQVNAKFGDEIALTGYQLDAREFRQGDVLTLTLNWRATQQPSTRYKVFVHLLDANNRVVAQRDGEPVSDIRITTTWVAGEDIADNYGVLIDSSVLPSEYRIEIGMYRADDGTRLQVNGNDHLILGIVQVK
jgi:uncharacterized membrane protein